MASRNHQTGKFEKKLSVWDGTSWEDGWPDSRGRFRVYRPDYPRAYSGGYALRAHVVWWLSTGECHPEGTNLHHKNSDKLDDRLENLQMIDHREHARFHRTKPKIEIVCEKCGKSFFLPAWRIRSRLRDGYQPKFCSQDCYHATR